MPAHTAQSITGLFYDGVLQPHAWCAALDAMNTHLQAGIFHGFTLDERGGEVPESVGNPEQFGLEARHMADYETHYAAHDRRLSATVSLAPGTVMLDHEHFSPREMQRNPVYADWLVGLGLQHTAGMVVRHEGSARDFISFIRPNDAKPFSGDDKRFIDLLMPDIARASRLRARMLTLARSAALGMAALEGLPHGIAAVDAQCRVRHANGVAERLFAQPAAAGALSVRHGRLQCSPAPAQERLQQLVRGACASLPAAGVLALTEGPRRLVVTVLPMPMPLSYAWASGLQQPAALIVVTSRGADPSLSPRLAGDILGLSPTETRLALLLADGKTIKEFAAAEGISWHTARTHLKNVMRKTGCHRQLELVALLQSLSGG